MVVVQRDANQDTFATYPMRGRAAPSKDAFTEGVQRTQCVAHPSSVLLPNTTPARADSRL